MDPILENPEINLNCHRLSDYQAAAEPIDSAYVYEIVHDPTFPEAGDNVSGLNVHITTPGGKVYETQIPTTIIMALLGEQLFVSRPVDA